MAAREKIDCWRTFIDTTNKRRAHARARTHRQANHQRVDTSSSVLYNSMATYYPNDKELASIQADREYRRNIANGHKAVTFGVLWVVFAGLAALLLVPYYCSDLYAVLETTKWLGVAFIVLAVILLICFIILCLLTSSFGIIFV